MKKTILYYQLSNINHVHQINCNDFTPGFYREQNQGVFDINLENELRNATRLNTKCTVQPNNVVPGNIQKECSVKILPNGYMTHES